MINGWKDRWSFLIKKIQRIHSNEELSRQIKNINNSECPFVLAFVNAHAMNKVVRHPEFYEALMSSDLIFRDGLGLAILYKFIHMNAGFNLNGTDLIPRILKESNGKKIALYGIKEPYLSQAKNNIKAAFFQTGEFQIQHGFHDLLSYINEAKKEKPDVVVLAMGMPKQEILAQKLKQELNHPCLIICGGAILDFWSGRIKRAPRWIRKLRLEWLYRLGIEPKRLFRRYVLGNPLFLYRVLLSIKRIKNDQKNNIKTN